MSSEDTIVQDIEIGGGDAAAGEFSKVGDAAEQAFAKIEQAASKANTALGDVGGGADNASKKINSGLKSTEDAGSSLGKVGAAATAFGSQLAIAGGAASTFATRVGIMAGAATAAVGGILLLARSMTQTIAATQNTGQSTRQMNIALKAQSQVLVDAQVRAVTSARAYSELAVQMTQGKITAGEYVTQLIELQRTQRNEAEDAAKIAKIQQEATKRRLEDLAKQQAEQEKRAALNSLVSKFGSDLTSSLLRLGNTTDNFWRQAVQGPSLLARAVDILNGVLAANGSKILEFYDRIINAIIKLLDFKEQGNLVDDLGKKFVAFGEIAVSTFETIIVPAIQGFLKVLGFVADAINSVLGTKFTAQSLVAIAIVFKLSGAFGLLRALLPLVGLGFTLLASIFGPWGAVIAIVVIGLLALSGIDWGTFIKNAIQAVKEVGDWFSKLPGRIVSFFSGLWDSIKKGASDAWDWVKQKASDAWDGVVGIWNGLVAKLGEAWTGIKDGAQAAWQWIVNGFQGAIDRVVGFFDRVLVSLGLIKTRAEQAGTAIQDLSGGVAGVGGDGTPAFARGGEVHGPGTPTSDSIWARLSRGEFVIRAAAVQRYGLSTLHALNQMRLRAPAFNMGGFVQSMTSSLVPRLAMGGAVMSTAGTGRPIVLNIAGESFHLLTRDADTAVNLGRFAEKRRRVSAGRKPSSYGA